MSSFSPLHHPPPLQLLGEKVTISAPYPTDSGTPSPHAHGSSPASISNSTLLSAQVAASNHAHSSPGSSTPSSAFQGNTPQLPLKRAWHGGVVSEVSPLGQHSSLTPDQFQVPVRMLNSLAAEGAATTTSPSGHMTGHATPDMGSQGQDGEPKRKKMKRRNSSISGSPLDDQGELEARACALGILLVASLFYFTCLVACSWLSKVSGKGWWYKPTTSLQP